MAATAGSGVSTVITVGTTSVQLVGANNQRRGVRIDNTGAVTVWVGFGTGNAVTSGMIPIVTTTAITLGPIGPEFDGKTSIPAAVPQGDIAAIATTTTGKVCITEW